jgi:hypothetical protein
MMLFLSSVLSSTGNGMKTIALRRGSSFLGSIEQKVNDYLATNIPEEIMSNEEIAEAYRQR